MRLSEVKTPCYVIDEGALIHNLEILKRVERESGARILLAQKCFSGFDEYPLIAKYISGATGSGLYEARLGYEEMARPFGKQNHVYAPAYKSEDIPELARICDHMIFNSAAQLEKHYDAVKRKTSIGVRINPQYRTQKDHPMYDPCAPGSRLGMKKEDLTPDVLAKIDGIHFHTMCEQRFDDLARTVRVVERDFGDILMRVKWLNMGGGQHITSEGYDVDGLIALIKHLRETYNIEVYLEPGEAVTIDAGKVTVTLKGEAKAGAYTLLTVPSGALAGKTFALTLVNETGKGTPAKLVASDTTLSIEILSQGTVLHVR